MRHLISNGGKKIRCRPLKITMLEIFRGYLKAQSRGFYRISGLRSLLALAAALTFMTLAVPAVPVLAAPSVVLSQYSGPTGTIVEVNGSGFNSAESQAAIVFGAAGSSFSAYVNSTVTVRGGSFAASFEVPAFPRGSYTVTVNTSRPETASATFQIVPAVILSQTAGLPGSQISIRGNGFSASSVINGYFDDILINSTTTDAYGTFSGLLITVPKTSKGLHIIKVVDHIGPSDEVEYLVNPGIEADPAAVAVGDQVSVTGSGFTASSAIKFTLDNAVIKTITQTDANGSFTCNLVMPAISSGEHTLKATDNAGSSAAFTLKSKGAFTINPSVGPAGTVVLVSGSGFGASKPITVTFNGINIGTSPGDLYSDENGNFAATIVVPNIASGTFPVTATDGTNSGTASYIAAAAAKVNQTRGPVGGNIPISGNGFNSGATIDIIFEGSQIATATADNNGAFSAIVPAPLSPAGEHTIIATDGINSIAFDFTIVPSAQASVSSGHVGAGITINGTAFAPRSSITVQYDGSPVASSPTDNNGAFSISFKAPVSRGGDHIIRVTDGKTGIDFSFEMETTPPAAPDPASPADGSRAEALTEFRWSPVNDVSGVTYTLQLSQDSEFNTVLIEKSGLTTPRYLTGAEEKLPAAGKSRPYYWRVQAVDGASNKSAWSAPQKFVIGFTWPAWVWYPAGVLGAALFFVTGFFTGRGNLRIRRKSRSNKE